MAYLGILGNLRSIKWVAVGLYLGIAAIGLAVVGVPSVSHAAIVTTPGDLNPGDQYRLAFVTSTTRNATSSDIGVYNAFVTTAANSQTALFDLGTTWTAIASTSAVDARDNTGTNPSSTGVPIYRLDGVRIADDNADLWDASIDFPLNIFEDGSAAIDLSVWTGTNTDGTKATGDTLGGGVPDTALRGSTRFANLFWVKGSTATVDTAFHFYTLSSELTVAAVPLPGAAILFGSGLAFLAVARRRNRNVRPS